MELFDVAIIGGGPAGSTCAAFCSDETDLIAQPELVGHCLDPRQLRPHAYNR